MHSYKKWPVSNDANHTPNIFYFKNGFNSHKIISLQKSMCTLLYILLWQQVNFIDIYFSDSAWKHFIQHFIE